MTPQRPPSPHPTGTPKWYRPLRRWQSIWMRWRGWRCEGPFPNRSSDAILILGPGLEPDSKEITLVTGRFQNRIVWWSSGDELPEGNTAQNERSRKRDRVLHAIKDPGLHELLGLCSESGRAVQLVSLAASVKAIRCNTPFVPSRFTEREEAYVRRIFSYYD